MITRKLLLVALVFILPLARAVDLARAMILLPGAGASPEDVAITAAQKRAAAPHATVADFERLGWAFVAKARSSLDNGYYRLAGQTADVMDAQFGATDDAALLRGHVFHNLHRFHEAETIARHLVASRGLPEDWALFSDALMEQGQIAAAVDALQHMVNLKPGAEADTRIAHLRWLRGDLPGAIAAMTDAIRATSPADKTSVAWMLARLSGFYLQAGDLQRADELARAAAAHAGDYAPALLAEGRARLAARAASEAVPLLTKAAKLNPLPEYYWWLAEACRAAGETVPAREAETALQTEGESTDPRTLALYLATRREQPERAVRLATAELANRQDVFTHDALAWALFAAGRRNEAEIEIRRAVAAGTKDPRLLLHATLIAESCGEHDDARAFASACQAAAAGLLPSEQRQLADATLALTPRTPSLPVAAATTRRAGLVDGLKP